MKGIKKSIAKNIAAFLTVFALTVSMGGAVFADFYDPAQAYAEYVSKKGNESSETVPAEENGDDTGFDLISETEETESREEEAESAVSGEDGGHSPAENIEVYSYKSAAETGESFRVGFRLTPADSDDTVTFTSSNSKIASVDSNGTVTAKSEGTAVITAVTGSGKKSAFTVTVKTAQSEEETVSSGESVPAKKVELKHRAITIYEGDEYKLQCEVTPSNSTDKITYKVSNRAVISLDQSGTITAMAEGKAVVTCTVGHAKASMSVTVLPTLSKEEQQQQITEEIEKEYNELGQLVPSEVRFSEESAAVQIGDTIYADARVYPSGSVYTCKISSDNPSVARVSGNGAITGVSPGNAVITITTDNGKTDSLYVTVYGNVIRGIDVSKWNGDVDWAAVRMSGEASYAMIRASYGSEDTDPKLVQNVKGCEENGIPYGFYHYIYAHSVTEAKREAAYFLNVIAPYSPEYPVVLDIEEDFYKLMDKREVTDIVVTFMEELENAGYYAMIYSYAKFINEYLYLDDIKDYDIWVACWGDSDKLAESYSYHYGMWQYTETGKIAGIDEYVDLNYCYKDYRGVIKKYGLNRPKLW
ncbi:MAG: Ig-like domain-containing protein [Ruminococcus sp.]|nr:Ig-like domain-containing protein [Ruminococcus sp.]